MILSFIDSKLYTKFVYRVILNIHPNFQIFIKFPVKMSHHSTAESCVDSLESCGRKHLKELDERVKQLEKIIAMQQSCICYEAGEEENLESELTEAIEINADGKTPLPDENEETEMETGHQKIGSEIEEEDGPNALEEDNKLTGDAENKIEPIANEQLPLSTEEDTEETELEGEKEEEYDALVNEDPSSADNAGSDKGEGKAKKENQVLTENELHALDGDIVEKGMDGVSEIKLEADEQTLNGSNKDETENRNEISDKIENEENMGEIVVEQIEGAKQESAEVEAQNRNAGASAGLWECKCPSDKLELFAYCHCAEQSGERRSMEEGHGTVEKQEAKQEQKEALPGVYALDQELNLIEEAIAKFNLCKCRENEFDDALKNFPVCNCLASIRRKIHSGSCKCFAFRDSLSMYPALQKQRVSLKPAREDEYCFCSGVAKAVCECEVTPECSDQKITAEMDASSIHESKAEHLPGTVVQQVTEERVATLEERIKELERLLNSKHTACECSRKKESVVANKNLGNGQRRDTEKPKTDGIDDILAKINVCSCQGRVEDAALLEKYKCPCKTNLEEKLKEICCKCEQGASKSIVEANEEPDEDQIVKEEAHEQDANNDITEDEEEEEVDLKDLICSVEGVCEEEDLEEDHLDESIPETEEEDGEEFLYHQLQPISEDKFGETEEDEELETENEQGADSGEETPEELADAVKELIDETKEAPNGESCCNCCDCPKKTAVDEPCDVLTDFAKEVLKHCSIEDILNKLEAIPSIEDKMNKIFESLHVGEHSQKSTSITPTLGSLGPRSRAIEATPSTEEIKCCKELTRAIEELKNEISDLKELKANVDLMEKKLAEKADACLLDDKVSGTEFEDTCEDLAKGIEDTLAAIQKQHSELGDRDVQLKQMLEAKPDKTDLDEMRDYFQKKIEKLREKVKELCKMKKEAESAAVRTKTIRDLRCLVCNADVIMRETGTHIYGPLPKGRCFEKRAKGSTPARKNSISKGPRTFQRSDSDFSCGELNPRVIDVVNRFCGGSHTITTAEERIARQPNIMNLLDF